MCEPNKNGGRQSGLETLFAFDICNVYIYVVVLYTYVLVLKLTIHHK